MRWTRLASGPWMEAAIKSLSTLAKVADLEYHSLESSIVYSERTDAKMLRSQEKVERIRVMLQMRKEMKAKVEEVSCVLRGKLTSSRSPEARVATMVALMDMGTTYVGEALDAFLEHMVRELGGDLSRDTLIPHTCTVEVFDIRVRNSGVCRLIHVPLIT